MTNKLLRLWLAGWLLLCIAAGGRAAQAATKEEEFFRLYAIPALVEQEIDQRIRSAIFLAFVQQFRTPPTPESLSEKDLAKTLEELDRLALETSKNVGFSLRGQEWRIAELFFKPGIGFAFPEAAEASPPPQPLVAAAAADFVREVAGSARLPAYQDVLKLFVPQQLQHASRAYIRNHPRDAIERLDENFRMQREVLRVLADSPTLQRVLPNGQELPGLRDLALRNREKVRANPALIPAGIEQAVGLTAQAVINDRSFGFTMPKPDAYREQLATVKRRVEAVMDKSRTPACRDRSLDLKTVLASNGDWTVVRTKTGLAIKQGSLEHAEMSTIYRLGCGGTRNFLLARKVMEDVAAVPSEPGGPTFGVRPDAKYCGLAQWKRHGIGGPKDEKGAQELEKRFLAESRYSCKTGSAVNPEDPWGDLKP